MPKIKNHAIGEYYHVYNRGMQKQPIFETDSDRMRFLFLLLTFQGKNSIKNISREIKESIRNESLYIKEEIEKEILKDQIVELVSFCLMPNHFHIQLLEKTEGGIAKYMQKISTAYTMYFNTKYRKSGHLLQGSYKSIFMEDDIQLMHTSAYIHKNPNELLIWKNRYEKYPWSSLQDYLIKNRFGKLLSTEIITGRYKEVGQGSYGDFIKSSTAKEDIK